MYEGELHPSGIGIPFGEGVDNEMNTNKSNGCFDHSYTKVTSRKQPEYFEFSATPYEQRFEQKFKHDGLAVSSAWAW